jgi:hypothetical protein
MQREGEYISCYRLHGTLCHASVAMYSISH